MSLMEKSNDESGLIGIYDEKDDRVAQRASLGLLNLQHRGQQGACLITNHHGVFQSHKEEGLVLDAFKPQILRALVGNVCMGYVKKDPDTAQASSTMYGFSGGAFALALNGALTVPTNGKTDPDYLAQVLIERYQGDIVATIRETMRTLTGAYGVILLGNEQLIGFRDPNGIRPLCLGKLPNGYVLATESCALDIMGAQFVRDLDPGEIVCIERGVLRSDTDASHKKSVCVFEYVYTSRPDSVIDGKGVFLARKKAGRILAQEHGVEADVVIAVPGSGTPAAIGYAAESGIPFSVGLVENRYIGRTFINPDEELRAKEVQFKLNVIKEVVRGQRVILVDDSIVRGTTSKKIIHQLRDAGAKEVHMRIASPQVTGCCYLGMDTLDEKSLIANTHTLEEIQERMGADSLGFISIEGLYTSLDQKTEEGYCFGCFSREYPAGSLWEEGDGVR